MQFTQECVYKYTSTQRNYGEKDREVMEFSADIAWHCDSSKIACRCMHSCVQANIWKWLQIDPIDDIHFYSS